ncbi:thiol-disulfide oxidoreductase DCC family protein [Glycocaulis sp.]|uniref:thiol-disulfide oxidoreductase DCC family protein n=1 Tax=Glycocaulis sp. TaxID=1969725 RepID=UPI003F6F318D
MTRKTQTQDQHAANASEYGACEVFFDGSCPMCRAEIGFYRQQGADAAFHDIAASPDTLPPSLSHETAMARFHVRTPSGELVSGARAFAELWKATPGWRWLGRIAAVPPLVWVLELAYRLFLPVRPFLQRLWRRFAR